MSPKKVLGRGMEALLPEAEQAEHDEKFFLCDIDKIDPNPYQPRIFFDEEKLQELAIYIQEKGVIQPLLVIWNDERHRYTLIAGERRLRASKLVGLSEIPVVVLEEGRPDESLELALIENIQRHDLNPMEEAQAYARLMQEFQLTQEEVGQKVGKQRSTVANILRLLHLPDHLQQDVATGLVSEGHARVLLRIKDDTERLSAVRDKIVDEGLSVRATERLCNKETNRSKIESISSAASSMNVSSEQQTLPQTYCNALATQLTNHLKTRVRIVQQGQRGRLEIEYYSKDDLERLLGLLS